MALKKFYIGSTGPFYYDPTKALPEDRNEASPRLQLAFRAEDVHLGDPDGDDVDLESVSGHIADTSIHVSETDIDAKDSDILDEAAMINWFF